MMPARSSGSKKLYSAATLECHAADTRYETLPLHMLVSPLKMS